MYDHVNRLLESLPRCKRGILKPKYYLLQDNSASAHALGEFDEKRCSDSKFCTFFYYLGQNEFSQKVLTSFYSKDVFKNNALRTSLMVQYRNPPANAGDTGSIPGLGRLHTPQGN